MSENFFYTVESPLDAIPTEKQMRTANFVGFPALVRKLGGDPRRILEHHGVDPQSIRDPDSYIDCQSLVDVLQYCSTMFNDPLFGLRLAQLQNPDVFGCVTALCRAASNFREAIKSFIEYIPVIHSPVPVLELVEGQETAELRWTVCADLGSNDQANFQAALLDLNVLRLVGGQAFRASYINLAVDARAKDIAEIEQHAGLPLPQSRHDQCHCVPDGDARPTRLEREPLVVHAARRLSRSRQSRFAQDDRGTRAGLRSRLAVVRHAVRSSTARRSSARRCARCNRSSATTT